MFSLMWHMGLWNKVRRLSWKRMWRMGQLNKINHWISSGDSCSQLVSVASRGDPWMHDLCVLKNCYCLQPPSSLWFYNLVLQLNWYCAHRLRNSVELISWHILHVPQYIIITSRYYCCPYVMNIVLLMYQESNTNQLYNTVLHDVRQQHYAT